MTRKFSMWLLLALLVAVVSGSASAQSLEDFTVFPDVVPGGFTVLGVVVLNQDAPKGGVVVSLSSNNAAATVPDSITIPARRRSAEVWIKTQQVTTDTTVTLTATLDGVNKTATLKIKAPDLAGVDIDRRSVTGGDDARGVVFLTDLAPKGGLTVSLSSDNAAVTVPATVTVAAGDWRAEFKVETSTVTSPMEVTITATLNGVSKTVKLRVRP